MVELIQELISNPVFTGVAGGSAFGIAIWSIKYIPIKIFNFISWRFVLDLVIFNEDFAFEVVANWLALNKHSLKAKKLRLASHEMIHVKQDDTNENLFCSPGLGLHILWYKKRPFFIQRYQPNLGGTSSHKRREDIRISTIGFSPKIMHQLIEQILSDNRIHGSMYTHVYTYKDSNFGGFGGWSNLFYKNKRDLKSVIMPPKLKESIINDLNFFVNSKDWYMERGIPYRKGILLYGPPGCGKTSLAVAIAGHLNRSIYCLNLGSIEDDSVLIAAITSVPRNSILLIEDIDVAIARPRKNIESEDAKGSENAKGITLSGLINSIDGAFSGEGRILIMTTNYPDNLDYALIRPGRVDRKEFIGPLHKEEALMMCERFTQNKELVKEIIDSINIPITPAELQQILIKNEASN